MSQNVTFVYISNGQDYSVLLGAVKCLPMALHDRDTVTQTIVQKCAKIKHLLFAVLIGHGLFLFSFLCFFLSVRGGATRKPQAGVDTGVRSRQVS